MPTDIDTYFNLVKNNDNNYTFYPILNKKYYELYKKQLATFWITEEIDLSRDYNDFTNKLNENERNTIKYIIAFFAASDGIVAENLNLNFIREISFKEVQQCLRFQAMMEDIHGEMYSLIIDTLITDKTEKNKLFDAINNIECVKNKANWAKKWTNSNIATIQTRLIAWICVEGIHFSGSFCAIYWLKKRNLMPGLTQSNEFIARDEGTHTETNISLYNDLKQEYKLSQLEVETIIREAVEIEKIFIIEAIPCAMLGMNSTLMKQYIEYVGDRLLIQLKLKKIYDTKFPESFSFMEAISVEQKTNFFEDRVAEYNKSGVGVSADKMKFDLNTEF